MKKMKPSVKTALVPTLVLASTATIAYAVPMMTNNGQVNDSQDNLKLEVERVDGDTVKVSIDNVQDIAKSLQFSVKLDGVTLQDGENSIHDLIEKEIQNRFNANQTSTSDNPVLIDYTYNQNENTIDVLITSNEELPKVGNKIDIFELDVQAINDTTNSYHVIPTENEEYKYVSLTNKEYSTTTVQHDNKEIQLTVAPTLESTERYITVTEGQGLTADALIKQLGLVLEHEDGNDDLTLEITQNNKVITEFNEITPGVYTLSLRAVKDGTLKSEAIEVQVNVVLDNITTPPTILKDNNQLLKNITINAGEKFLPLENVTATDAKQRPVEVTVKTDKNLDLDPDQDTEYVLTYTATDIYGNMATKEVKLTVLANQAPVILGAEDVTIKVGDTFNAKAGVTVTDDKDQNLQVTVEGTVNTKIPGTYKLSYSVTDSGGKTTRVQRTVTVEQAAAVMNGVPFIIAKDITIKAGDKLNPLEGVIAYDKEDGDLTSAVKVAVNEVDTATAGTYRLVYQVTDSAGATATKEITVTVLATMKPVNNAPTITASDRTITVGTEFDPMEGVTASDKEDGDLTKSVKILDNEVNIYRAGKYYITYQVTDSAGATTIKTITVQVNPKPSIINAAPFIFAHDQVITVGEHFDPLDDVVAYDREDAELTHEIEVIKCDVDTNTPGSYEVIYQVTDSAGATTTKTITVTVMMKLVAVNTPPQIIATDLVLPMGTKFDPKENVSAYDEEDLDITHKIEVIENTVDTTTPGEYTVTYQVTDSGGATTIKTITVQVNPKPSVVNAIPFIYAVDQTIKVGDTFDPFQYAKAYDLEDLDLTHKIEVIENTVDTTRPGDYTVTYQVTDSAGATATKTITVTVLMKLVAINTPPTIFANDLVLSVGEVFNPTENIVAYDKEDLDITHQLVVAENDVDMTKPGTYTVTYRVTDSGGATTTKTITVTVKAKEDINLATSITINNKDDNKIYVNGYKNISAQINDEADIKNVEWIISDPSIAELRIVRNEARIVAKASGEVTLTAMTTDGSGLTDTITLQITNFEEDSDVPTYVKDMIDPSILTPLSGAGLQESPLEFEVNDIEVQDLDAFLSKLSSVHYRLVKITDELDCTIYHLEINEKVGLFNLFKSKETAYINIKVSHDLTSANDINEKLKQVFNANTAPVINVDNVVTELVVGSEFDPLNGVLAWDVEDNKWLTDQIEIEGTVDTSIPGEYVLTYTVTDSDGLTTSVTVTFTVVAGDTDNGAGDTDNGAGDTDNGAGDTDNGAGDTDNGAGDTDNGAGDTDNGAGDTDNGAGDTDNGAGDTDNGAGNTKDKTEKPTTGYTGVLGYLGLTMIAIGGALFGTKKKKN